MRTGHSNLALRAMRVAFNRLAPPDAAGKPQPALAFSDADRTAVVQGLLAACDPNDGVKDGLIFDTRGCRFSPASLACKGAKADGCLSAPQVAASTWLVEQARPHAPQLLGSVASAASQPSVRRLPLQSA